MSSNSSLDSIALNHIGKGKTHLCLVEAQRIIVSLLDQWTHVEFQDLGSIESRLIDLREELMLPRAPPGLMRENPYK
ncbi:hypothetical protein BGZ65_010080, partial [Modicella reniformis]